MLLKSLKLDAFLSSRELSFLFRSFVHEMRHERLLYGDKSPTWHRNENDATDIFLSCSVRFQLWRFHSRRMREKWKMTNLFCEKTMIRRFKLFAAFSKDWISLETNFQFIITMWLKFDVLRLWHTIKFLIFPQQRSWHHKNAENRKLSQFRPIKSPWKLIKFLFVALGHSEEERMKKRARMFRNNLYCISIIKVIISILLLWLLRLLRLYETI